MEGQRMNAKEQLRRQEWQDASNSLELHALVTRSVVAGKAGKAMTRAVPVWHGSAHASGATVRAMLGDNGIIARALRASAGLDEWLAAPSGVRLIVEGARGGGEPWHAYTVTCEECDVPLRPVGAADLLKSWASAELRRGEPGRAAPRVQLAH